jgi:hypothetical protein
MDYFSSINQIFKRRNQMRLLKTVFLALFFVIGLNYFNGGNLAFADDDFDDKYENHEEGGDYEHGDGGKDGEFEEIGETVGWGTVIAMGAAGLIFPIRRSAKTIIKSYPESKNVYLSISKFFGKYHILIGIAALALAIFHGTMMFLSEGELEGEGIVGLGSGVLMAIAGILGIFLFKNKKLKNLRTTHTILIAFAIGIGLIHIFAS